MKFISALLFFWAIVLFAFGQEALPNQPSPTAIASMKHKETYLKVTYSRPQKKGREIFGGLVPFGKVWRTGANEATEITLTDTIFIANDTLNAGTYSIFTIPEKNHWTIIFNKELGQWGSYNYLEDSDVLRVEVPVIHLTDAVWEPFTITFEKNNDSAELVMKWDRTMVMLPIRFIH